MAHEGRNSRRPVRRFPASIRRLGHPTAHAADEVHPSRRHRMATKKVGVIGSGTAGRALADGFLEHGYEVMRGTREPAKLAEWKRGAGAKASVGTFADTARHGEVVVLAVKGLVAESALDLSGAENLAGKVVIDTTNPLAAA